MKYFIDAAERVASGREDYIEFQKYHPTDDFWDAESLYMSEDVMRDSGFGAFWSECVIEHGSGFMDTICAADWSVIAEEAKRVGEEILEVVNELAPWIEKQYAAGAPCVGAVWEVDRALERRRLRREAYSVDPKFYEEVRAIGEGLSAEDHEEEYEKLLRKYNMPSCFFPFPICEPDQWE